MVIAGDTVPCAGLDELCGGADVLVHTVARRDLIEQFGLPRLTDVLDYHSSVPDAARTTREEASAPSSSPIWCRHPSSVSSRSGSTRPRHTSTVRWCWPPTF